MGGVEEGGEVASGAFHQCDRYEQVFKIDEKWLDPQYV